MQDKTEYLRWKASKVWHDRFEVEGHEGFYEGAVYSDGSWIAKDGDGYWCAHIGNRELRDAYLWPLEKLLWLHHARYNCTEGPWML